MMWKIIAIVTVFGSAIAYGQETPSKKARQSSIEWHVSKGGTIKATPDSAFYNQNKGDKQTVKVYGETGVKIGEGKKISKDEMRWVWSRGTKIFNNTLHKDVANTGYVSTLQVEYNVDGQGGNGSGNSNALLALGDVGIFGKHGVMKCGSLDNTPKDALQIKSVDKGICYFDVNCPYWKCGENGKLEDGEQCDTFSSDNMLKCMLASEAIASDAIHECFPNKSIDKTIDAKGNVKNVSDDKVNEKIANLGNDITGMEGACFVYSPFHDDDYDDPIVISWVDISKENVFCNDKIKGCQKQSMAEYKGYRVVKSQGCVEYFYMLPKWRQENDYPFNDKVDLKSRKWEYARKVENGWKNYIKAINGHEEGHKLIYKYYEKIIQEKITTIFGTENSCKADVCCGDTEIGRTNSEKFAKTMYDIRKSHFLKKNKKTWDDFIASISREHEAEQNKYDEDTDHGVSQKGYSNDKIKGIYNEENGLLEFK